MLAFEEFPKVARLMRNCTITEKLDGTNAQVCISDNGDVVLAGSRKRWVTPEDDNFGFAAWVREHEEELVTGLGPGRHFGEWWGRGIQRGYAMPERRFSLFNTGRWDADTTPECCHVVPVLYEGLFHFDDIDEVASDLRAEGSAAAPGFMKPEGIMIWHHALRTTMKWTFGGDGHKG